MYGSVHTIPAIVTAVTFSSTTISLQLCGTAMKHILNPGLVTSQESIHIIRLGER